MALQEASRRKTLVLITLRRSRSALDEQLGRLSLRASFAHVLSDSGDGDRAHAKARLFREACGPSRGWLVGDTETDIRAGRELGLRTAGVTFGIRTAELVRAERPDLVLESPEELVGFLSRFESGKP
jgi:phosphoglycolate phosphatase